VKHGMNTEKEGGEDGAWREPRPTGRARLLPSRDSSVDPADGPYSEGRCGRGGYQMSHGETFGF